MSNVLRDPSKHVCCTGWRQQGKECTIREFKHTSFWICDYPALISFVFTELNATVRVCAAVCEGEQACLKNEICLFPGVCRCPAGFYGAQCKTRTLQQTAAQIILFTIGLIEKLTHKNLLKKRNQ